MAESELNLYKKEQRRNNRSKVRQAVFITEYVFCKYFSIYQEAAQLFNEINRVYPKKPDLRRTTEFKNWKRELQGLPKIPERQRRNPTSYPIYQAISFNQPPNETHVVQYVPEGVNDNAPLTQIVQSVPKKVMQLRIPLMNPLKTRKTSPEEGTVVNSDEVLDEGGIEPSSPEEGTAVNSDEVLDEGGIEPSSPEEGTAVNSDEVLDEGGIEPSSPEEGTAVNSDEVLDEGGIEPSLFDDIPPETMEKLITELRTDPYIAAIMDDFEAFDIDNSNGELDAEHPEIDEQLELGMEVEIDDRLEKELEDTLFW